MLAAAVSVAAVCSDKARIDVDINQAASSEVVVKKLNVNKFEVLDTVAVDASGKMSYAMEIEAGQPEFVYLFHGDKKIASLLLSKGEKVHVSADTLGNYTVTGSEESARLAEVEKDLAAVSARLDALTSQLEGASAEAAAKINAAATQEYVAALRFVDNKKVFIHYDNTEYLLYDFGAQVGDTLEIFGGIDYYEDYKTLSHVVTKIDTLEDGRLQMQLVVELQWSTTITWIEGIGSRNGIVHNIATDRIGSGTDVLLCAYRDNECIYTTSSSYYAPYGCVYNDPIFSATKEVKSPTPSAQKIMYNGQLLILRDGKTYNVMGQEL
jgi:hypothetical protein